MSGGMRVIGIRRDPRAGAGHADAVHAMSDLDALLPQADFVALTCPLTAETEKLIDADAPGRMKPSAYLLNATRGRVVDEPALVDALARRQIRGAALDVVIEKPLPATSPLWAMEHVLITPRIPVAPRNIFPSNIQGLPTWYEVRISETGHLGARGGTTSWSP